MFIGTFLLVHQEEAAGGRSRNENDAARVTGAT
jgi:hypothetical protein